MLKFTERPKTTGITSKKDSFLRRKSAICIYIKDTFAESLQLRMSLLHQSMCIFKAVLSGLHDGCAKYKEKVPDVSDPNQNVGTTCSSKLKFT